MVLSIDNLYKERREKLCRIYKIIFEYWQIILQSVTFPNPARPRKKCEVCHKRYRYDVFEVV